ncbi:MAG TPA: hypothetical protein VL094_01045 [Sphingomonadaceae bacterium]|nr:hypothetical protein [Sphingomonadaceae bacterium]
MSYAVALIMALNAVVLAFVVWKGGTPERLGAMLMGLRYGLVDPAYHAFLAPARFDVLEPGHAAMDIALFLAMAWLALRANRIWPLCMCACALVALVGHFVVLIGFRGQQLAYWGMTQIPLFLELTCIVAGTISHRLRLNHYGPYRNWRLA